MKGEYDFIAEKENQSDKKAPPQKMLRNRRREPKNQLFYFRCAGILESVPPGKSPDAARRGFLGVHTEKIPPALRAGGIIMWESL